MFSNLNLDELAAIAIMLDEDEKKTPRRRHRFGVHKMSKRRKEHGEYWTLFRELLDDEEKFYQYFRMPQHELNILLSKIQVQITKKNTSFGEAIGAKEKLAVCLRFLSTGDSYRSIAFSYRLGHSTVSSIVIEVCDAIIKHLMEEYMAVPSQKAWLQIADDFWNKWNFSNCAGAIDGKHVLITAPAKSGSLYYNYKKTFSIVLLALVDANYKFIAVDIGSYGKNSDGGIFSNSKLGKCLAQGKLNLPGENKLPNTDIAMPHVIIGDEAFPLKTYLLRPYPRHQLDIDDTKRLYNYRHCRARRVSENAFGILSQKFRIFHRKLQLNTEHVDKIVLTTCILQNYILSSRHYELTQEPMGKNLRLLFSQGGSATSSAFLVRDTFKQFFNSEAGSIEWMNEA